MDSGKTPCHHGLSEWLHGRLGREPIYEASSPGVGECLERVMDDLEGHLERSRRRLQGNMERMDGGGCSVEGDVGCRLERWFGMAAGDPSDGIVGLDYALDRALALAHYLWTQREHNLELRQSIESLGQLSSRLTALSLDAPDGPARDLADRLSILTAKTAEYRERADCHPDALGDLARLADFLASHAELERLRRRLDEEYAGLPTDMQEALVVMATAEAELAALEEERANLLRQLE